MDEIKKKEQMEEQVTHIDEARIQKLALKGNYYGILEEFEILRLKFIYDTLTKEESINFITYCKYVMKNGHSEVVRLSAHYLYKRYIENKDI